ncbi:OmpA family protein [Actinomyces weissii]|uniref:OmpA family protein n=2 Tax=Actinomyces weissii TaxID=675090 RepID=A0A7T7S2Q5_9ACTO|nr:OmpA family protein [Actinomyces weissii]
MEGLRKAKINASLGQGLPIEFFSGAADGSLDTQRDGGQVTVSLASDVTFAVDSDQLSVQADGVLAGAVAELGLYPSGGSLSIVGHTDDVADDAYNQALSEKRAASVRKRLGELMDLSKWQVSESGKGESEPRVQGSDEEARAANRRVEVVAKPADPQEAEERRRAVLAQGSEPAPEGPVGKGPEGVTAPLVGSSSKGSWKVTLDKVTRIGSFLVGNLHAQNPDGGTGDMQQYMQLPSPFFYRWGDGVADGPGSASLTLLKGGVRYLAADYKGEKGFTPLTTLNLASVGHGATQTLPVVWPDPGGDTVTVDLPGASKKYKLRGLICRLTDVPVVQG